MQHNDERTLLINDYDEKRPVTQPSTSSYILSRLIFLLSSVVATISAAHDLHVETSMANWLTLIVAILYCLGYGVYTAECWRDQRNQRNQHNQNAHTSIPIYTSPHVMRLTNPR